jgi:hypothetical protein
MASKYLERERASDKGSDMYTFSNANKASKKKKKIGY